MLALAGAVVEEKGVAVGGEDERDVEGRGVLQGLLHAVADAVVVVLCLDQGDGDVRLVVENVVGTLGFAAGDELAADDDPALGESRPPRESATSHPTPPASTAGVMNLVQMSRSVRSFLFMGKVAVA